MGSSSCFSLAPLHHSLSLSCPSSSSVSLSSRPFFLYARDGKGKRGACRAPMASLFRHLCPQDLDSCKRRAFLILGISMSPFLPWRDKTYDVLASEDEESRKKENQKVEQMGQKSASSNPFLSLLNAIGILSSGVLAALYSMVQKDKVTLKAKIESLNSQLKEKNAAIVSLGNNFETKLSHQQDEQNKLLTKAKEEQLSLANSIESANDTISGLRRELQSEKRKTEELQIRIGNLDMQLGEAEKEKLAPEAKMKEKDGSIAILQEKINLLSSEIKEKEEAINTLRSSFAQKDSDLKKLTSAYEEIKNELDEKTSQAVSLKAELSRNQSELILKNMMIDGLNSNVNFLITDQDNLTTKLNTLELEYDGLKSSSDVKAASDAKFLREMEQELHQLKGKYDRVATQGSDLEPVISDLTQERENLKNLLDVQANNVKTLKQKIQLTEEALGSSRNEISELNKQLNQSKKVCSDSEIAFSKVQAEFSKSRESLQKSLNEVKLHSDSLAGELTSVKEELNETKNKKQLVSSELAVATQNCDSLEKELLDVYKMTEVATNGLKEEKKKVASLKDDLGALEKLILEDKEATKLLEMDRDEARRSLEEMGKKTMIVSKNLKMTKTRISNLEEEKDFLNNALEKEKEVAREARENLEDVHSLVKRLGSERESLDKRAKKLTGDLASAKGEILRLRNPTAVNSKAKRERKPVVNSEPKQEAAAMKSNPKEESEPTVDNGTVAAAPVKRARRRKSNSQ